MPLSRYDASHTTFRVLYIAIPARNQMNVYMENGLTCISSDVDAHVETRHLLIDAPIPASMARNIDEWHLALVGKVQRNLRRAVWG